MINCWAENPEKRPPFDTLQQDLDDFEISSEAKYSKYDEYVPNYRSNATKKTQGKGGKRADQINKRKKKAR